MTEMIYTKLTMEIPELGTVAHVAELQPMAENTGMCRMVRLIELSDGEVPSGGWVGGKSRNLATPPQEVVPHPDTFDDFPEVQSEILTGVAFDELWEQIVATYPDLAD
ncbi:hypothetical protein ACFPVT_03215 [Corynebacterium choanae]|uniref:Uncharacterized protein n=1 Tax=Corynebacterium choanae TaxID=1862358 RepID=A0A3G6JDH2_9CORY|nr:hypothetical protein [Corynebacterium choanae]AZA14720.1 hypothetical protein CCHOA_11745 [Corynebacterium choanae]